MAAAPHFDVAHLDPKNRLIVMDDAFFNAMQVSKSRPAEDGEKNACNDIAINAAIALVLQKVLEVNDFFHPESSRLLPSGSVHELLSDQALHIRVIVVSILNEDTQDMMQETSTFKPSSVPRSSMLLAGHVRKIVPRICKRQRKQRSTTVIQTPGHEPCRLIRSFLRVDMLLPPTKNGKLFGSVLASQSCTSLRSTKCMVNYSRPFLYQNFSLVRL